MFADFVKVPRPITDTATSDFLVNRTNISTIKVNRTGLTIAIYGFANLGLTYADAETFDQALRLLEHGNV